MEDSVVVRGKPCDFWYRFLELIPKKLIYCTAALEYCLLYVTARTQFIATG